MSIKRPKPLERPRLGYLCDGCHSDPCYCDEREAERAREWGPICPVCSGGADDGYEQCEFAGDPVYEAGPGDENTHGCPRMTGTF